MDRKKLIHGLTYIGVCVFSVLFLWVGNLMYASERTADPYCSARVESVGRVETEELVFGETKVISYRISFSAKIRSGDYSGLTVDAEQYIDGNYVVAAKQVEAGDSVVLLPAKTPEGGTVWSFIEYNQLGNLGWLSGIFLLFILLIGRRKGFSAILSLVFDVLAIFAVYIPGILAGANVYMLTIVIAIYIIFMSLLLLGGPCKKTWCAICGNIGGVGVAALVALLENKLLYLTGIIDESYASLLYFDGISIDPLSLVWAGIVIGALGAVMDVALSIASAMNELSESMREKSFWNLLRSGMNIGTDAIGTMSNTLVLAYIGCSIATVLLMALGNRNLVYLLNLEMIIVEVLQAIIGSLGILFTVPLTALFSSVVFTLDRDRPLLDSDKRLYRRK